MTKMAVFAVVELEFSKLYVEYLYVKLFLPDDMVDKNDYYIAIVQLHGALEEVMDGLHCLEDSYHHSVK